MPSGKGQDRFEGSLIQFGSEQFPDWESVRTFFEIMLKPSPASKVADTWDSFFNSEDTVTEDFGLKQEDRDWLNMRPVGREKPD